jgi:hypothetical protein
MTRRLLIPALLASPLFCAPALAASGGGGLLKVSNLEALSAPEPAPIVQAPPASAAAKSALQPAPLPNPDVDGPRETLGLGPGLTPALFHEKAEFQGAGFSPASNIDHGLNERRAPAAGLNWTVPVK